MLTEMNAAIETEVNAFIEEYSPILELSREEMLCTMGYLKEKTAEEGAEGTEESAA